MGKVLGIDLGTTNSVVAIVEGGNPIVIPNSEGFRTTPSVVAYSKNKELLVGQVAKRQSILNPENTFYSVKRFIGSKTSEITTESTQVSYKVIQDLKKNVKIYSPALEKEISPEEISSYVIRKLTNDANKFLNDIVSKAVITVPAYFNDSQRQATKDAGKIAGLEVLRIINEPTAAALAYGLDKKTNETILIFDLGGGTFDVSILEVGDGVFEVLATSGDSHLGGDDFDSTLMKYIVSEFEKKEGMSLSKDKQALQRILEASEKAKIELSNLFETTINLPYIAVDETGPKHIDITFTRAKLEEICSGLIQRCRLPVETALRDAKINTKQINEVILVGGSTRIPAVQKLVKDITQKEPNLSVNPDEVVAMGAAINGAILGGDIKDILLLDVTPLSLGVETLGGLMTTIIPKNSTIPTTKTEIFSTADDNQRFVDINVLQGQRQLASDNKSLGYFQLENIPPAPRGKPQIEVTFDINVEGILSVSAKDRTTEKSQSIKIQNASTLDKAEIEKIIEDAEKNASLDQERRKKVELKNQAESLLYKLEKKMKDSMDTLTLEQKTEIENYIQIIKEATAKDDYTILENKLKEFEVRLMNIN